MVTLPMTLSDPYATQTTPICTFCTASQIFIMGVVRNFKFVRKSQPADVVIPGRGVVGAT